jgi:hypothetical protein
VPAPGVSPRPPGQARYPYDVNEVALAYLERFPLLVLRRSPIASRPPANFDRVRSTKYYDVWQRRAGPTVLEHLPIARPAAEAGAVASCRRIASVAARASAPGSRLAYVERQQTPSLIPTRVPHPPDWGQVLGDPNALIPRGSTGQVVGTVNVPAGGSYRVWVQGTFDRAVPIWVGGRRVGRAGPRELGPPGSFVPVGGTQLPPGPVQVRVVRPGDNLAPGDGGTNRYLGPVVLEPAGPAPQVRYLAARDAHSLCGRRLDWVEAVR